MLPSDLLSVQVSHEIRIVCRSHSLIRFLLAWVYRRQIISAVLSFWYRQSLSPKVLSHTVVPAQGWNGYNWKEDGVRDIGSNQMDTILFDLTSVFHLPFSCNYSSNRLANVVVSFACSSPLHSHRSIGYHYVKLFPSNRSSSLALVKIGWK
jgi:hypothetical protein